ncbi:MAG TPA: alpha/beta hydrolase [Baekduia sp.]
MTNPFAELYEVPVAGGRMLVARAGPPPGEAAAVVLAVHGISASHMAWRAVARRLVDDERDVCVLAPDLRGRAGSGGLPGPYGMTTHVADLLAVLDDAAVPSAILAGHSMGGYVVARLAAEHPERAAAVVLVDGGLPLERQEIDDVDAAVDRVVGPALQRLGVTFATAGDYLQRWRDHPALAGAWDDDVEAWVSDDLEGAGDADRPDAVRSATSAEAVYADGRALLLDDDTINAVDRVRAPLWLLRARRGMVGDEHALIPAPTLAAFAAAHPDAHVEDVADVNHYTLLIGPAGSARVASAIHAAPGAYDDARAATSETS